MLSIGKVAKGQEGYYLDAVARGVEDYYLEGEAPGRWLGAGTALLGLAGEVDAAALAALLDGRDPTTDTRLRSSKGGRIPGFDLTFRAPKSVSVVFGLAEADIASVVAEAHDLAVDAALGYLRSVLAVARSSLMSCSDHKGAGRWRRAGNTPDGGISVAGSMVCR